MSEITNQLVPFLGARVHQEAAFTTLALMVYGLKLESSMMGSVLPETVKWSSRTGAFGGVGKAMRRLKKAADRQPFKDKFFSPTNRKDPLAPYQDRSGQMSASIRVEGRFIHSTSSIQFEGSVGDFISVAPLSARFQKGGSKSYSRNYYAALDGHLRRKTGMSLIQHVERAMMSSSLPENEYSVSLEAVRLRYQEKVLSTSATKTELRKAKVFLSKVKARSNLQNLDPRRLVPYPR